jgi:hypothetical protein
VVGVPPVVVWVSAVVVAEAAAVLLEVAVLQQAARPASPSVPGSVAEASRPPWGLAR